MRFDIDCMLGHKHKSKTKWGAKKMKHRCTPAHIFWSFLLHQVRRGELALEDILSDAMAALSGGGDSSGNGENGGGGCGNSDIVGYTGNSPPIALTIKSSQWQNWKTLLMGVLLVCGTAIAVMSCKKGCDPKTAKPGDECYQDTTTVTDPYAAAKKECESKSHPDSTYSWNNAKNLCEATYVGELHDPAEEKRQEMQQFFLDSLSLNTTYLTSFNYFLEQRASPYTNTDTAEVSKPTAELLAEVYPTNPILNRRAQAFATMGLEYLSLIK